MGFTGNNSEKAEKEKEEINPRCIVKFRPADDWKGEYGFDWFREGDYGERLCNGKRQDYTPIDSNGNQILDNQGNPIIIKSKTDYKADKLVGRYIGDFRLCEGNLNNPTIIRDKDEFTDNNGNIIYTTKTNLGVYTTFHSKSVCTNCIYRPCRILPSNNNEKEVPWVDDNTGKPNKADPDCPSDYFTSLKLELNKQDNHGRKIQNFYEKEFEKNNYELIQIKSNPNNYIVPSINLLCKEGANSVEVKVKLLIHAEDILLIDFVVDEGAKGVILNPNGIVGVKNGDFEHELSITLTSDFAKNAKDISIRAIATHRIGVLSTLLNKDITKTLAGKINILKWEPKYVDIVIVKIPTRVAQAVHMVSYNYNIEDEKKHIKKLLSQAQIIPRFIDGHLEDQTAEVILNAYKSSNIPTYIDIFKSGQDDIVEKFVTEFNKERRNQDKIGKYKLFFMDVKDENGYLGLSIIGGEGAIVFPNSDYRNTACHELTHCFGLYHSFSNNSPYTLEKYKTSNIMDYQDPACLELLTFWRWQWEKMRATVEGPNTPQSYCIA